MSEDITIKEAYERIKTQIKFFEERIMSRLDGIETSMLNIDSRTRIYGKKEARK